MTKLEQKLTDAAMAHKEWLFVAVISVMALAARLVCFPYASQDMAGFLLPWYGQISELGGLRALSQQVGDYNIPYQFIIGLFTYLPVKPIYLYKLLSVVFDYALAFTAGTFASVLKGEKRRGFWFALVYGVVLMLPTVVMNSGMWGQCDSIFSTFAIGSLMQLYRRRYRSCFVLLGLALAFKMQTVFVLPFYIYCYFERRDFSVGHFLLAVLVFWLTGLPGFLFGRSLLAPFYVYAVQSLENHKLVMNTASLWQLFGDRYWEFVYLGVLMGFSVLGGGLYLAVSGRLKTDTKTAFLSAAVWSTWTSILFLPKMHDRYGYLTDLLLLLLAVTDRTKLKYAAAALMTSLISYAAYFGGAASLRWEYSCMMLLVWLHFTYTMLTERRKQESASA